MGDPVWLGPEPRIFFIGIHGSHINVTPMNAYPIGRCPSILLLLFRAAS